MFSSILIYFILLSAVVSETPGPCQNCNSCDSDQKCDKCDEGYYLFNGLCYSSEPTGVFCLENKSCQICRTKYPNCTSCDTSNCYSCDQNYFLIDKLICTLDKPTIGYYCNLISKTCKKCLVQNCQACSSDAKTCSSCIANNYFLNNECFGTKPVNAICDKNYNCDLCTVQNCAQCDLNKETCDLCQNNMYLQDNSCQASWNNNYYCDSSKVCKKCTSFQPCKSICDQSLYRCSNRCPMGQYEMELNCFTQMPNSSYCDIIQKVCFPCTIPNCLQCSSTLDKCTKCSDQYLFNGECTQTQPINTYCDSSKICTQCSTTCSQYCDSKSQCLNQFSNCPSGQYSISGQCQSTKPDYHYCDPQTLQCQACTNPNCLECDNQLNLCTKCLPTKFFFSKNCLEQQPPNTYCDSNHICTQCNDNQSIACNNFCDSMLKCLPCPQEKFSLNGVCYDKKPPQTYCDPTTLQCKSCSVQNCNECDISDKCLLCNSQMYNFNNKCNIVQPVNTYCDSQLNCRSCSESSGTSCLGYCDSSNLCILSCPSQQYQLNGNCYKTQPQGAICDSQTFLCRQCTDLNCYNCDNGIQICSQCNPSFYLFNNICYKQPPQNTFCNSNNQCTKCSDISSNNCVNQCDQNLQCINSCQSSEYFYNGNCQQNKPSNSYCDKQQNCQQCKNNLCGECDSTLTSCNSCKESYYLYQDSCFSQKPSNTYCDPLSLTCQKCNDQLCQQCDSSLNACSQCKESTYMFEEKCFGSQPSGTQCNIIGEGTPNQYQKCQKCSQSCQECTGTNEESCNNKNNHQDTIITYPSSISQKEIEEVKNTVSTTSKTTQFASTSMSLVQGVFQSSGSGLLISGLTSQKLTYMILVKTKLPQAIQFALEATKGQIPSQQFQEINFLGKLIQQDENDQEEFFSSKFKVVNLKFSILETCGQGVTIFLICESLFALFYIFLEKLNNIKIKKAFSMLYTKLFSGIIIQYIQLTASIFTIGINTQFLEFTHKQGVPSLVPKIILVIILISALLFIIYKLYYYLNTQNKQSPRIKNTVLQTFEQITSEKAQNETISESKIRRNFMLIFLIIESIIQPSIFILLNENYTILCALILINQIAYIVIICYFMPFYSKLTNLYFLIDSILWLSLYIQYLIVNIIANKEDINKYASSLDRVCWFFIANVQAILLLNPIYMVAQLTQKIIQLIQQKMNPNQLDKSSQQLLYEKAKFEINDINYDQIYRQIQVSSKIELSTINSYQKKGLNQIQKQFLLNQSRINQQSNQKQFKI